MSVDGLDQNIGDIFPLFNHLVKVLVITETYTETLASVCNYFFISYDSDDFNHLLHEFIVLQNSDDTLILSQARSKASD